MYLTEWPGPLGPASRPPGERPLLTAPAPGALHPRELDPGHDLLPHEWQRVVATAERIAREAASAPRRFGLGTGPDGTVPAKFHGGKMAGAPTFVVIHSAETPLADGYVASIAEMFRQGPAAGTSAHHMVGPRTWLQLLPEDVVAYAAGPKANPRGVHIEQTGYARFTRAEWTTRDGLAQVDRVADCARAACNRWGIPKRWATDAQLRSAAVGGPPAGLVTHAQVARVLGGTTHTDPEPHYPGDLLLASLLINGGPGDMAELTGNSLQLLQDVQGRVRGTDPNLDSLQVISWKVDGILGRLDGTTPDDGDRLGDLWNQGGAILAAVQGLNAKLDQALKAGPAAAGPSAAQVAAELIKQLGAAK